VPVCPVQRQRRVLTLALGIAPKIEFSALVILRIRSPLALPEAAIESYALGAQNLKRENCFASLRWIALCWSSKSS